MAGENAMLPDDENDCPIEQVRLTVLITDDPTMPVLTFRTWSIGLISCVLLAFSNQFFSLRRNAISISPVCILIVSLPLGRFMAATLPTKSIRIPMTKWSFSLNPGPFNLKEHVLISIFATSGAAGVYAVNILVIVKAFYHRKINFFAAYLLTQTTQLLGYGWAGIFRHFLVDSPYMWWPANLVSVSLFRALHEEESRLKRGTTRLQFFLIALASSFCYYIFPGYLFPSLTALSIACWIWPNSITAQQMGSGLSGLGIGSFTLDWSTISSFLGTPLSTPWHAIANVMVGFFVAVFVLLPFNYWTNTHDAKRFSIISSKVFNVNGTTYDTSRILDSKFEFSEAGYNSYSKIYLSIFFLYNYGLGFATLTATLSHVLLFHGRDIWQQSKATFRNNFGDVHTRLMKKNYAAVPQWWFHTLLVVVLALSIWTCEGFGKELQLPYWGILLAVAVALIFTLPIGIITATTNRQPGLNIITELIIGYLYPGKPLANVCFKTYGYISMSQAISFVSDFKLGHYMKIPPRSMFFVQLIGTLVATSVQFGTAWMLLTTVENICDPSLLPKDSPWTCPGDDVFYSASIIWGVVGPNRMFGPESLYSNIYYFFLAGFLAPVPFWLLSLKFPNVKWIGLINVPILLGATTSMPPARSLTYLSWGAVGFLFNFVIYRRYKGWWARYNYVLAAALDAGIAFMAILLFFALQSYNIYGLNWWGMDADDHCPLARCPTAPGIVVDGCPVIS